MTFHCTLCDELHEDHVRTDEHVVPECLGSRSFVHSNVCARINGGLAHSIERPFHAQSSVNAIMLAMNPRGGSKLRFIENVTTTDGRSKSLFQQGDNRIVGDLPTYSVVGMIPLSVAQRNGTILVYELALPFSVPRQATATQGLIARDRYLVQARRYQAQIEDYLRKLIANPDLDRDFAEFVRANDVVLGDVSFNPSITWSSTPAEPPPGLVPRPYAVDLGLACRYFAKIALLFAAESPEPQIVREPAARKLRQFLMSTFVAREIACTEAGATYSCFESASIGGGQVYWWALPQDSTEVALNTSTDIGPDAHSKLVLQNAMRISVESVSQFFCFEAFGSVDDTFHAKPASFGVHDLDFANEPDGLWCRVRLFGGLFSVRIHLSERRIPEVLSFKKHIETPWFHT